MKTILLLTVMTAMATMAFGQEKSKSLVVYYSRTGNTETVAEYIQKLTGADMFRVETLKPYPEAYHDTTDLAKEEKNRGARPAIKGGVENMSDYDTVFIGFPIWWGTYPMAMATFMENHDLAGKAVIPFCTHGGGGVDKGFTDVKRANEGSVHKEGLSLNGGRVNSSLTDVEKWLRDIEVID